MFDQCERCEITDKKKRCSDACLAICSLGESGQMRCTHLAVPCVSLEVQLTGKSIIKQHGINQLKCSHCGCILTYFMLCAWYENFPQFLCNCLLQTFMPHLFIFLVGTERYPPGSPYFSQFTHGS